MTYTALFVGLSPIIVALIRQQTWAVVDDAELSTLPGFHFSGFSGDTGQGRAAVGNVVKDVIRVKGHAH